MQPAVVFDHVWKKFRRGERHDSLRDLVPAVVKGVLRRSRRDELEGEQEFWALNDVAFDVQPGEALGIIGPNGAGKSTALKLLTKILRPTRGHCHVQGRVGALIEVAAGFHPDLTGRENIYLQGAIMGMHRQEIEKKLDEIIDFSGIESFIDTPVKRFSSGMQARLGFSVAAHLDPDVLFVDEVLSVGDLSFQAKCLEKMKQKVGSGVTLIFVSHNLQAVASLCKRAIVIGRGSKLFDGDAEKALDVYLETSRAHSTRYGAHSRSFAIRSSHFGLADGSPATNIVPHRQCRLVVEMECLEDANDCAFGMELERTRDLLYCYGTSTEDLNQPLRNYQRGQTFRIEMGFTAHLTRGHYRINVNVRQPREGVFRLYAESVANFTVEELVTYDGVADVAASITVTNGTGTGSAIHGLATA